MEDGPYTRGRLREEWKSLVARAEAAAVPPLAILDTMIEVAVERYAELYGDDVAANTLRDLLLNRFPEPVTEAEVARELIAGEEEGPESRFAAHTVVI